MGLIVFLKSFEPAVFDFSSQGLREHKEWKQVIILIDEHDKKSRYCPMLGHGLNFKYCRSMDEATPCRKIYDCWWENLDIKSYMEAHFSKEVLTKLREKGSGRIGLLYESILKAQKKLEESGEEDK